jgi:hypothetical protein
MENLNKRDHLDDLYEDGRILLKYVLNSMAGRLQTGFTWLRTLTICRLL